MTDDLRGNTEIHQSQHRGWSKLPLPVTPVTYTFQLSYERRCGVIHAIVLVDEDQFVIPGE